jgi:hypothetical protein
VNPAEQASRDSQKRPVGAPSEPGLLSALAGTEADRTTEVAQRTRRVVSVSLGLMREQKANLKRNRSVALAVTLLVPVLLGPFIWWAVMQLLSTGRLYDPGSQLALWVCMLCPALAAAVLVAGWTRR